MCVAFRLLHDFGSLKPGDGVILNAANSTVGTCIIQLCRCLKLRPIAVVRDPGNKADADKLVTRLKSMGAAEARASWVCFGAGRALTPYAPQVLMDGGSIKAKLEENKFFAKPRLALDAVGGPSAVALADALQDGCPLVMCVPPLLMRAPRAPCLTPRRAATAACRARRLCSPGRSGCSRTCKCAASTCTSG